MRQWAAVDGFDLQDQVLEIVDSGVVEPAALPRLPSTDVVIFVLHCSGALYQHVQRMGHPGMSI